MTDRRRYTVSYLNPCTITCICKKREVGQGKKIPAYILIIDIYKAPYPLIAQSALQYNNMAKTIKESTK